MNCVVTLVYLKLSFNPAFRRWSILVWNSLHSSVQSNPRSLWFCLTTPCDWLKCSRHPELKLWPARTRFPALGAGMYLLRALIGSLRCLGLLWLAGVISQVLVPLSFECFGQWHACRCLVNCTKKRKTKTKTGLPSSLRERRCDIKNNVNMLPLDNRGIYTRSAWLCHLSSEQLLHIYNPV